MAKKSNGRGAKSAPTKKTVATKKLLTTAAKGNVSARIASAKTTRATAKIAKAKTTRAKTTAPVKSANAKSASPKTPPIKPRQEKLATMTLLNHLLELRRRLFWCLLLLGLAFAGCYYFASDIYSWLAEPLFRLWQADGDGGSGRRMVATSLTEIFFTNLRLAFYVAMIITMPLLLMQLWLFIAPGLYRHEKKTFVFFLLATPFFFVTGAAFVYYLVIPVAWKFFLSFEDFTTKLGDGGNMAVELIPKVSDYLSLVLQLILAFGLSFEVPVLLMLLLRLGVITKEWLVQKRRYAIVLAFIVAAVLTPPDPLSQILLALPLIALYEIAILSSHFIRPDKKLGKIKK